MFADTVRKWCGHGAIRVFAPTSRHMFSDLQTTLSASRRTIALMVEACGCHSSLAAKNTFCTLATRCLTWNRSWQGSSKTRSSSEEVRRARFLSDTTLFRCFSVLGCSTLSVVWRLRKSNACSKLIVIHHRGSHHGGRGSSSHTSKLIWR